MKRFPIRYQAAIVEGDHVLLLRVIDLPTGETFWLFPGGGILDSETPEDCVKRELFEETSLQVVAEDFLFDVPDIPEGLYERLHTYLCRVQAGSAIPGIEPEVDVPGHNTIQEVRWFDLRDPANWPELVLQDPITFPQLQRLRQALGYPAEGSEDEPK